MQNSFIAFIFGFCIILRCILRVSVTCTTSYNYMYYCLTLSKVWNLATSYDFADSVREVARNWFRKLFLMAHQQGWKLLITFLRRNPTIPSVVADILTATRAVSMKKICWNGSKKSTANFQKKAFICSWRFKQCLAPMRQHFS